MNATPPAENSPIAGPLLRLLPRLAISLAFMAALLFVPAGTYDWPVAWAFLAVHLAFFLVMASVLLRDNPDLISERSRVVTQDTKPWDKVISPLTGLFLLAAWVVAGLDRRLGWSSGVPLAVQVAALLPVALGYGLFGWAMASNPFFSRVVRLQDDRGHTVASAGPYRVVRHPGYSGFILAMLATAFALNSLVALIPAGLASLVLVIRTALEDRTLHAELDGYPEFAANTRYRLLPGIW